MSAQPAFPAFPPHPVSLKTCLSRQLTAGKPPSHAHVFPKNMIGVISEGSAERYRGCQR